MLPFEGNLTALLVTLAATRSALKGNVYEDSGTVALKDRVFDVKHTSPCYAGLCKGNTRQILQEGWEDAFFAEGENATAFFMANGSTMDKALQRYDASCKDTYARAVDVFKRKKRKRDAIAVCGLAVAMKNISQAMLSAADMRTPLEMREQYLLEDVQEFQSTLSALRMDVQGGSGA